MKPTHIVFIIVGIIALIAIGVYVVKSRSIEELYILYDDRYKTFIKLKVNEKGINNLTNINEIKKFIDLTAFQKNYFCLIYEFFGLELIHNTQFYTSLKKLLDSMIGSTKEYLRRISRKNPDIVAYWMRLDDTQLSFRLAKATKLLDEFFGKIKNFEKNGGKFTIKKNEWILMDSDNMKSTLSKMNRIEPTNIDLLPDDEKLYSDCLNILLKLYDDRDRVMFENIKMTENLMEKQRKLIRIFARFGLIEYPMSLFYRI